MKNTTKGHILVPLSKIVADPNQPRQEFEPMGMKRLAESIASQGILQPLMLEKTSKGKYLIVDGERRFRTATKLGLKEVPAIIMEPMTDTERIISRFNIQEQQQSWTAYEKAIAISNLRKDTAWSLGEISNALGLASSTVQDYELLLTLSKRSHALASENRVAYTYLSKIARITRSISNEMRDKLQQALINRVISQDVTSTKELNRYKAAIKEGGDDIIKKIITDKHYNQNKALKDAGVEYFPRWNSCISNALSSKSSAKFLLKVIKSGKKANPPEDAKIKLEGVCESLNRLIAKL